MSPRSTCPAPLRAFLIEAMEETGSRELSSRGLSFSALAAPDPCQPSPCSSLAQCSVSPTGQAQCRCPKDYHGDGTVCLPQDPCNTNNGGCPSNSTVCQYKGPGKVSQFCPSVHPPTPAVGPRANKGLWEPQLPHL